MTKPHEEEWEQDANATDWVNVVCDGRTKVICRFGSVMDRPKSRDIARARLASKAPKMARALLSLIEAFPPAGSEEEDEALEFARKALREAGVLE